MPGVSWLAYTYADTGEIYSITGVPGIFPSDGAMVDVDGNQIVRHIMRDDLEALGFTEPAKFQIENYWDNGWVNRGPRPTDWYMWDGSGWVINTEDLYRNIRYERFLRLAQSDWTQGADSPLTEEKKAEWRIYRQALRDIMANLPEDLDDPAEVVWPSEPS